MAINFKVAKTKNKTKKKSTADFKDGDEEKGNEANNKKEDGRLNR